MSVKQTIARNTAFNGLGRIWEAVIGLVLVAYIVSVIGIEHYGLWGVVAAFTGYVALFDVGFGSGYAKYVAEYAAKGQREKISEVVTTGLIFYVGFGALFIGILWPLSGLLIDVLEHFYADGTGSWSNAENQAEIRFLVHWSIVLFAVGNCVAPFTAVQSGLQRMGITNLLGVGMSFVKLGGTVYYLENGYGVRGLLYTQAWVLGVYFIASALTAFRLCPELRIAPRHVSSAMMGRLFQFGWRTQVARLANLIMFQTDVLVIAFLLNNLALVGLYQIGVELANKMRQVPVILFSALIPAVSDLEARDDHDRLRQLYLRSTKYAALITLPMVAFTAGTAALLIPTWQGFGEDWHISIGALQWLLFGYIANILAGSGVSVVLGMGRPEVQMKSGLISLTVNIALTVLLVKTIGFWGIPIATVISMYISWGWFLHAMREIVEVSPAQVWRDALRGAVVATLPVALLAFIGSRLLITNTLIDTRLSGLIALAFMLILCVASYLWAIRRRAIFGTADLDFMDTTLKLKHLPGYRLWSRSLRDE